MTGALLAHVILGGPVWPLWVSSVLLFGGLGVALATSGRRRSLALAIAGAGLLATVALYAVLPSTPPAPAGVSLRIAAPADGATVTSPVVLRVCAAGTALPGPGRLLVITVDGRVAAEVGADTAAVDIQPGTHAVSAELVTSTHAAYAPPVRADEQVTVTGHSAPAAPGPCP